MKRNLVIFRAGSDSLHPHCLDGHGPDLNWDFAISAYVDAPARTHGAVFVEVVKDPKWQALGKTLRRHWPIVSRYERVWFPDDDLLISARDIHEAFAICADLGLELAQPALTEDSHHTYPITLRHAAFQVRFTNFVEVMAPMVSLPMLSRILPTFDDTVGGWGLDTLWPRMSSLGRVAILDAAVMKHTRPVGTGTGYDANRARSLSPDAELLLKMVGTFNERLMGDSVSLGGLLQDGDFVGLTHRPEEFDRMLAAVAASMEAVASPAEKVADYLERHRQYGTGNPYPAGMVREALGRLLDTRLAELGIRRPDA